MSTESETSQPCIIPVRRQVQRNRPQGYESVVEVSYQVEDGDVPIEVRGRIDGLYPANEPATLEEIKKHFSMIHLEIKFRGVSCL